jgi:molybdenum cofactor guanylyltransferase
MSVASKDIEHNGAPIEGITGIILAGGKSSRYGKNKAFVEINGVRLIERVIRVLGSLFKRLMIITNSPGEYAYLQLPMAEDIIKGLGPIGGIYTGLEMITDEAAFFVACDMPFLNEELIRHIIAQKSDFDAIVPQIGRKTEALHALYSKRCLPAIREIIDVREYQIIKFFTKIRVKFLDEREIRTFDPLLRSFFNINRPDELQEIATGNPDG